ncbi:MAG: hypothetical protein V4648_03475 [Bacteroidota bacterium]
MNYLRITKYLYLIVGFVMLYAAFMKKDEAQTPWLEIILAGTAFFMYFFRNRFDKKFQDRNKQNNPNNQSNP